MGLPALYVPPQSPDDWAAWSFNHAAIHSTVLDNINSTRNQDLTQFILDPIEDFGLWQYQHQLMHNQANAVLGTTGYNLLDFDLDDPGQFEAWLQLNGAEHLAWNRLLGV